MKKSEQGAEPSMEEILASIRKIIAEEPIGSRPEPARRNPRPLPDQVAPVMDQAVAQGARAPAHPGETRAGIAQGTGTSRRPIAIDDALADLLDHPAGEATGPVANVAQAALGPTAAAPAAIPAAEPRQRPSWLFSHPHPVPDVASATVGRHEPSRPVGPQPSPCDASRSAVRAEPEPATCGDEPNAPPMSAIQGPQTPGGHPVVAASPPEVAVDRGAVVARQLETSGPSSGRDLASISGRESSCLQREAAPPTVEPTPKATVGFDALVRGPLLESALRRSPDSVATEAAKPFALKPPTAETAGPADAAVRPAAALSSAVAIAETVDTATVAANSALDALSQRLAASAGTRGKATDNVADASSAAMPVTQPVRTLEDTVTDLLRPMLRQWLDANMPRIVEKALRVELAEGVKPGVKTDAS